MIGQTIPQRQVWLASYVRSGNTYLRALLAAYEAGGPIAINDLSDMGLGEHDLLLWRLAIGLPLDVAPFWLEWCSRGHYFDLARRRARHTQLVPIKTHTANVPLFGHDAFPFHHEDRAILLVRHPGDIAVSMADYLGISLDAAIDQVLCPHALVLPTLKTRHEYRDSWPAHTLSWLDEDQVARLVVRYDDLVARPSATLRRILEFLDIPIWARRVAAAAAATRFDVLRAQERQLGFVENLSAKGVFFRAGVPNQWQTALSRAQVERIETATGPVIRRLGLQSMAPVHDVHHA